jgi:hypothetical protein
LIKGENMPALSLAEGGSPVQGGIQKQRFVDTMEGRTYHVGYLFAKTNKQSYI